MHRPHRTVGRPCGRCGYTGMVDGVSRRRCGELFGLTNYGTCGVASTTKSTTNFLFSGMVLFSSVTICYFLSVRTENCTHIYAIFRPYGWKFTVKFRYFLSAVPSLRLARSPPPSLTHLIAVWFLNLDVNTSSRKLHTDRQSNLPTGVPSEGRIAGIIFKCRRITATEDGV